jgi:hypothetical protein
MVGSQGFLPRPVVVVCIISLVLVGAVAPVVTAIPATLSAPPETDNTVTRIHVSPNGSAQWTVTIRTRLDTDDRVAEYEAFQARFRENTSRFLDPFRERMEAVVATAGEATDREMHAVNFTASTSIQEVPRRWGVVTYRFTWTNFAAQENGALVVGDVFQGGFYLAANDTLEIETPADHEIADVEPKPASREDGVVTWVGREDFADRQPRVEFVPTPDQESPTGPQQPSTPSATTDRAPSFGSEGEFGMLIGGLLLGLVGAGAYTFWWRRDAFEERAASGATESNPDATTETASEPPTEEGANGTADAEIMTDAERVQALLAANDGRMRQAAIADDLDWSASKTSRVISDLVDEGTVEKLQLGRENVIDLTTDE